MIHAQEIAASKEIILKFQDQTYVMLIAPMQSGKTNTFKLTACEMFRLGFIDNIVIFSGNRETDLRDQTTDNESFNRSYRQYLRDEGLSAEEAEDISSKITITVCWGPGLNKFTPEGRTFYVWEESHYGQSKNQQVDLFLTRLGIQATGSAPDDCFVLSVSATPFSELSDNFHLSQEKAIVRLIPSDAYLSVEKMRENGQIVYFKDLITEFRKVISNFKNYGLVRASENKQIKLEAIALTAGCLVIHYDLKNKGTALNVILSTVPTKKTVVFLKGMCRMGKQVDKQLVDFVMETSKGKTDTILQGLLGRCCGYRSSDQIKVYLYEMNNDEIDRFIRLSNGDFLSIPCKAQNIKPEVIKTRWAIIPLRLIKEDEDSDEKYISDSIGLIESHNTPEDNETINAIILKHCLAKHKAPKDRTSEERISAKHCVLHKSGKEFKERLAEVKEAFSSKTRKCEFGSGLGVSATNDEIVIWESNKYFYITAQIELKDGDPRKIHVPKTNKREVFCRDTEVPRYGNPLCSVVIKDNTRTDSDALARVLDNCSSLTASGFWNDEDFVDPQKICSNGSKCFLVTPDVFTDLTTTIYQRFKTKGIELSWKKVKGRTPAGCEDIRLSEIAWTVLPLAVAVYSKTTNSTVTVAECILDL